MPEARPWKDGAYISVSFTDVPVSELSRIYSWAVSMGHEFNVHVSHAMKDNEGEN